MEGSAAGVGREGWNSGHPNGELPAPQRRNFVVAVACRGKFEIGRKFHFLRGH